MDAEPLAEQLPTTKFFPVSMAKFCLLSILTGGLYEIYWFYKNFKYIKLRDQSQIWPLARALFAPLWFYSLIKDINRHSTAGLPVAPLALVYFLMVLSWELPDPYWLIAILSFVPLLLAVLAIAALNEFEGSDLAKNSRWRWRHSLLLLLAGPFIVLGGGSTIGYFPSGQVVPGSKLWANDIRFLREHDLLEPDEEVVYFYSTGLFSIADDGNILTNKRVISYWTDYESGEDLRAFAHFNEIADIKVQWGSSSFLEDTELTITRTDSLALVLLLSPEGGKDKVFVRALRERVQRVSGWEISSNLSR